MSPINPMEKSCVNFSNATISFEDVAALSVLVNRLAVVSRFFDEPASKNLGLMVCVDRSGRLSVTLIPNFERPQSRLGFNGSPKTNGATSGGRRHIPIT